MLRSSHRWERWGNCNWFPLPTVTHCLIIYVLFIFLTKQTFSLSLSLVLWDIVFSFCCDMSMKCPDCLYLLLPWIAVVLWSTYRRELAVPASPWLHCWWRRLRVSWENEETVGGVGCIGITCIAISEWPKCNHEPTRRCEWRLCQPEIVKGFLHTYTSMTTEQMGKKKEKNNKSAIVKEKAHCPSAAARDYLIVRRMFILYIICSYNKNCEQEESGRDDPSHTVIWHVEYVFLSLILSLYSSSSKRNRFKISPQHFTSELENYKKEKERKKIGKINELFLPEKTFSFPYAFNFKWCMPWLRQTLMV